MVSTFFGSVTGLIFLTMGFLISILGLLIKIFVGSPLEVGEQHFFLKAQVQEVKISDILYAFQCRQLRKYCDYHIFNEREDLLWVPAPRDPESSSDMSITWSLHSSRKSLSDQARVFDLSRQMMDGEKMNAFVLELSFLPWQTLEAYRRGFPMFCGLSITMAGTKQNFMQCCVCVPWNRAMLEEQSFLGLLFNQQ